MNKINFKCHLQENTAYTLITVSKDAIIVTIATEKQKPCLYSQRLTQWPGVDSEASSLSNCKDTSESEVTEFVFEVSVFLQKI